MHQFIFFFIFLFFFPLVSVPDSFLVSFYFLGIDFPLDGFLLFFGVDLSIFLSGGCVW